MRYPTSTPTTYTSAKSFVEKHGTQVWCELCDTVLPDEPFRPCEVAGKLPSLTAYKRPVTQLLAVLHAVQADFEERPEAYTERPIIRRYTKNFSLISI